MNKNMTVNIPLDMAGYYFLRMDIELLESYLNAEQSYLDMPGAAFLAYIRQQFELFKAQGDTKLISRTGKHVGHDGIAFAFLGNRTLEKFPITIIGNVDNKTVAAFGVIEDFMEQDNGRGNMF